MPGSRVGSSSAACTLVGVRGRHAMSIIATSVVHPDLRSSSWPSPAWPTTSSHPSSIRTTPSRTRTESSATITRMAASPSSGALTSHARELEPAVESGDPVVQASQSRTTLRVYATDSVVAHLDLHDPRFIPNADGDLAADA